MKKVIAIAFIAASFAACNNKADKKDDVKDTTATETPVDTTTNVTPVDTTAKPAADTAKPVM